ncbi:hypothetical protein ASE51_24915 [Bacillus sp. Root147]|nr:hypothetical protein ASE51_24915 [Bacillus sp. Root147]
MAQNDKENPTNEHMADVIDFNEKREKGNIHVEEGIKWLRQASLVGDNGAMNELAFQLLTGKHELKQNVMESEKWLQKAAEAGETIAMREWGKYLIHGVIN